MLAHETARRRRLGREAFLLRLYTLADGNVDKKVNVKEIIQTLEMERTEIDPAIQYLTDANLTRMHFNWADKQGLRLRLTSQGVSRAEDLLESRQADRNAETALPDVPKPVKTKTIPAQTQFYTGFAKDLSLLLQADIAPAPQWVPSLPTYRSLTERVTAEEGYSPLLISYDPKAPPGVEERLPGTATIRRNVSSEEYYTALLGQHTVATILFTAIYDKGQLPAAQMEVVDDALAEAYHKDHDDLLTPPIVLQAIRFAYKQNEKSGPLFLQYLADAWDLFKAQNDAQSVTAVYTSQRLKATLMGCDNILTDLQTSVAEFMIDYLHIQRAVAIDIARSEQTAGELRAKRLSKSNKGADLLFEAAMRAVLRRRPLQDQLQPAVQKALADFEHRRTDYARTGLLDYIECQLHPGANGTEEPQSEQGEFVDY